MARRSQGRPVDPTSERSRKPWKKLNMSRASFYWRKRYGDVPKKPLPGKRERKPPSPSWEELVASL